MAKNKIIYGDETLIDLTNDTVSPNNLLLGETAHDRSGESIQGNVVVPTVNDSEITIQKNGVDVGSFTLNQSTDKTINITMSKSDVGLDNVPNVSTDDQTPTFTEASTRTNIASGEKLSVILGKIKKFFTDLKTVAFTGSYNDLTDQPTITDNKVTQTNTTTTDAYYRVLLSGTNDNTTRTEGARKSGNLIFNSNTSALRISASGTTSSETPDTEILSQMIFANTNVDGSTNYSASSTIRAYHDHQKTSTSGNNLVINAGAGLFIGSGEGASNHYAAVGKANTAENIFITSDSNVHIQANGQTIANRKGLQVTTNGNVIPDVADFATNNSGGIGTVNYKWANGYFVNINGVTVGDSPKFTDHEYTFATGDNYGTLKINETDVPIRMKAIQVGEASDLDDYQSPGIWYFSSTYIPTNAPVNSNGILVVFTYATSAVKQVFFRHGTVDSNDHQTFIRTYGGGVWGSWKRYAVTDDAEKVKQIQTGTNTNQYRLLLTTTDDDAEETNTVRKCSGVTYQPSNGTLRLNRPHTSTTNSTQRIIIGNDIPVGTAGNNTGQVLLYARDNHYCAFWDRFGAINADRQYELPNQSGMLALRDNITRAKLDSNWNLLSTPYYTADGTSNGITRKTNGNGSITFTGTATGQHTFYVRRYSDEWTLPAGKYRLSGCPSGGSSTTYRLRVGADTSTSTTTWLGYDTGSGYEFTLTEEKIITVTFNIYSGYAIQGSLEVAPTLVRLDDGWVNLGATTTSSTMLFDIYSEFMIEFNIAYTFAGTTSNHYVNIDAKRIQLTSTEKQFTSILQLSDDTRVRMYFYGRVSNNNIYVSSYEVHSTGSSESVSVTNTLYAKR